MSDSDISAGAAPEAARGPDRYALDVVRLVFRDRAVEAAYVDAVLRRTLGFCRVAWAMVVILGAPFALLDATNFPEGTATVTAARVAVLTLAVVVIGASYLPRLRRYFTWSSVLFTTGLGAFCALLVIKSPPETMSAYFAGFFFAFAGIFSIVGLGFVRNTVGIALTLAGFVVAAAASERVESTLLVTYVFFSVGTVGVYGVAGYLVERLARETYASGARLADSLADLRRLSGLLPICSSCKSIRDDQGYWAQIEQYVSDHSEAVFSHGLCPTCAVTLFPEFAGDEAAEASPEPT